jgi:light-regulated signal transduction histidine kinase (bacteriophytochrome)
MVDMNRLVEEALEELNPKDANSNLQVKVSDLPAVNGDVNLLKRVFVNLLSNAIKYSGKKEKPVVEVGAEVKDGEHIYYVKDNGAGFDSKYKEKLFGVFQRLHKSSEFEGTGIGLAIVHRIISRSGGSVWAEGEVNKGASFYFSLPAN